MRACANPVDKGPANSQGQMEINNSTGVAGER